MIIFFFSKKKKVQEKNKVLEDISDIILGRLKEKYSPKYFYQRFTQSKSGSSYLIIRKKRGRLTEIDKAKLISNIKDIIPSVYSFYFKRHEFVLHK